MAKTSEVWEHFTEKENGMTDCNYCGQRYSGQGQRNGTSSLRRHYEKCKKKPDNVKKLLPKKHNSTIKSQAIL